MNKILPFFFIMVFSLAIYANEKIETSKVIQDAFKTLIRKEPDYNNAKLEVPLELEAKTSKYYYIELAPNQKTVLTFKKLKSCGVETEEILFKDFEVINFLHSEKLNKRVPVRVKSYYIASSPVCLNPSSDTSEKKIVIGPFSNKMTQIHITTPDIFTILQSGDCGVVAAGYFFDDLCNAVVK